MKGRTRKKVDATFNMSSMTDIVFLLLIFFIVLSTFVSPPGVDVDLPKANGGPTTESATVTVGIDKDGQYSVNGNVMEYAQVMSDLKAKASGKEYPSVVLEADGTVSLEKGVALFADIKNLGYTKIVIATQPKDETR